MPKITNIDYGWDVGGRKVIFYDDIDQQEEVTEVAKMFEIQNVIKELTATITMVTR